MRTRKMRRLSLSECMALSLYAARLREEVDGTLADLVERVAAGDDSALVPAVDRLKELGRDEQAERLKRAVLR